MINLQPYSNPQYLVLLLGLLSPLTIGLYFGRRFKVYEAIFSIVFLALTFGGDKWQQGVTSLGYIIYQFLVTFGFQRYAKNGGKETGIFSLFVILAIIPLIMVKVAPVTPSKEPITIGFLGIFYLTLKIVQAIMELRDGTIKEADPVTYAHFLLFFPVIFSGPIDRYRRFIKDYNEALSREEYLNNLELAVRYLFQGFLHKFVLGWLFGSSQPPQLTQAAIISGKTNGGLHLPWALLGYMYCYSMYLFSDFAGYSLSAASTSYFVGIRIPMNFNKLFSLPDVKESWNRWHTTLSFWFGDFIFMRLTFFATKRKLLKDRIRLSQAAHLIDFLTMSLQHGVAWYCIVYGILHACAIIINDYWLRSKRKYKK